MQKTLVDSDVSFAGSDVHAVLLYTNIALVSGWNQCLTVKT